jgi:hypothetical protein
MTGWKFYCDCGALLKKDGEFLKCSRDDKVYGLSLFKVERARRDKVTGEVVNKKEVKK